MDTLYAGFCPNSWTTYPTEAKAQKKEKKGEQWWLIGE
jgi:hypothetical protein